MRNKQHAISWFEIPVSDMKRAKKFYQDLLEVELTDMAMENGLEMAMFPMEKDMVSGALCYHPEYYKPSHDGTLVYFSANPDLQKHLAKVKELGGKVLQEKTQISDEYGFMAVIEDSEGNRVALHSNN